MIEFCWGIFLQKGTTKVQLTIVDELQNLSIFSRLADSIKNVDKNVYKYGMYKVLPRVTPHENCL